MPNNTPTAQLCKLLEALGIDHSTRFITKAEIILSVRNVPQIIIHECLRDENGEIALRDGFVEMIERNYRLEEVKSESTDSENDD